MPAGRTSSDSCCSPPDSSSPGWRRRCRVLVVGRFVQGLGAGVVPAIGYVAIGRAYTVEQRARMFAILSTAWVVPGVVGPALAERVSSCAGWRWVFLGLLPLVVVAGLVDRAGDDAVDRARVVGSDARAASGGVASSRPRGWRSAPPWW